MLLTGLAAGLAAPWSLEFPVFADTGVVDAEEPDPPRAFDERVEKEWRAGDFPSLSYGIVRGRELAQARSFGLSSRETGEPATPQTLYRIGSITKVFTATLLALLRDQGAVRLDDPAARFLPDGVPFPADPRGAPAITLRHLATHTSGLPRLPVNLAPRGRDPYGGHSAEALLAGLPQTRLQSPVGAKYGYSNLGYAILGYALERAAGELYEPLIRKRLLDPLGMKHTAVRVSGDDLARLLATGYEEKDTRKAAAVWDLGCLAPAGGLVSSIEDLARFAALQLRAGEAGIEPVAGGTLAELQAPQRVIDDWKGGIGLGWQVAPSEKTGDIVWHNGEVGGFASYLALSPRFQVGVIVLANCEKSVDGLGRELLERAVKAYGRERPEPINPDLEKTARGLSAHFVKDPEAGLAALFHETFLAEIPFEQVKRLFQSYFEKHGACKGVEVSRGADPFHATVRFAFAAGRKVECDLAIDGSDKPRIVYLLFKN